MNAEPFKFSGREDYFAVNGKPAGVTTSFRVSGRMGELARRFARFDDAEQENKRLNRAYRMGFDHGVALVEQTGMAKWFKAQRIAWISETVDIFGFINREHIERKFGVSTPQASLDLRDAMAAYPDLIVYNRSAKRYERAS